MVGDVVELVAARRASRKQCVPTRFERTARHQYGSAKSGTSDGAAAILYQLEDVATDIVELYVSPRHTEKDRVKWNWPQMLGASLKNAVERDVNIVAALRRPRNSSARAGPATAILNLL